MSDKLDDKIWLKKQYEIGRSLQDIADELHVARNTIRNRFIKFKIKRRPRCSHFKGVPKSSGQRAKMSKARKAYWDKNPMTDELRLKISQSRQTKDGISAKGRRLYILGRGRVFEHRLVAEQMLGRPLSPNEQVHHIDGDRLNNSPENLLILINSDHQKLHNKKRQRDNLGRFTS